MVFIPGLTVPRQKPDFNPRSERKPIKLCRIIPGKNNTADPAINNTFRTFGTRPVSYTHLDVYKRQTISWRGIILYSGPADGLAEPLNISARIGPVRPGQVLDLDFYIFLPGPPTGNEFQGSTVTTRIVLITACGTCLLYTSRCV